MPISQDEQMALDEMKAQRFEIYRSCMTFCREALRADETLLRAMGHKTPSDAIVYAVKDALSRSEALDKAFLRRFPD